MKNKLKGGLEGIIALVILAGIVIALIVAVILPMVESTSEVGETGKDRISGLRNTISGSDDNE